MIEPWTTEGWIGSLVERHYQNKASVEGLEATVDRLIDRIDELERWIDRTEDRVIELERGL